MVDLWLSGQFCVILKTKVKNKFVKHHEVCTVNTDKDVSLFHNDHVYNSWSWNVVMEIWLGQV